MRTCWIIVLLLLLMSGCGTQPSLVDALPRTADLPAGWRAATPTTKLPPGLAATLVKLIPQATTTVAITSTTGGSGTITLLTYDRDATGMRIVTDMLQAHLLWPNAVEPTVPFPGDYASMATTPQAMTAIAYRCQVVFVIALAHPTDEATLRVLAERVDARLTTQQC